MDVEHHTSEMDGLRVQDPTEQQNGPHMQWKNAASRWIRRCWSCKFKLYLAISIIIYIVLGVKIVEMGRNDARKRCGSCFSCHPGWLLNGTVCYYISIEERNWTSSKNFCSLHGAFLARIENEEKDFVMQYKKKEPYWIGLTRHSGQPWKWLNGDLATLEVLGEGENCAYLVNEEEAKASISRCSIEYRWICSGPANSTGT